MYPSFDANVQHYGIRTTGATAGVTVTATTSDPAGHVTVDGKVPDAGGNVSLTGLTAGQQIRVEYDDALGLTVDSLIYLPSDFPQLVATTTGTPQPGEVFLNVGGYATAVDQNAVPVFLRSDVGGADFKQQPNGNYSTAVPAGNSSYTIAEFDKNKAFQQIASHTALSPVVNTDSHDSILEPNGNQVTISYEKQPDYRIDAVIQEADSSGQVVFSWNSSDHFTTSDAYVTGPSPWVDYMHINSIRIMSDGDFLASFRNLSAVVKIARDGSVVWQLGGKHNQFTFVNDPLGGPCAQHAAYELPNGHILLFDDGAKYDATLGAQTGDFCPDPSAADPNTTRIARPESRAVEYAIDATNHVATLVWQYDPGNIYTAFAGSAQRLDNGDTLIDWAFNGNAGTSIPIATEVDANDNIVWELTTPGTAFSYRAFKFPVVMAPDVPQSVSLVAARNAINVSWQPPASEGVSPITGYRVSTSTSAAGPFQLAGTTTGTSFAVDQLPGGTPVYVKVAADNAVATSPDSAVQSAVPYDTPTAPRSLQATAGKDAVTLSWTAPLSSRGAAITSYRVYRRTSGSSWSRIKITALRSLVDSGLRPGTRYYYAVIAVNKAGLSALSVPASAVPYWMPSAPRYVQVSSGVRSLTLRWMAPASSGGLPITAYRVQWARCRLDSGACFVNHLEVYVRSVTIRHLRAGHRYYLRVRAVNRAGAGPVSSQVSGIPRAA